jgi:hypothetical protein
MAAPLLGALFGAAAPELAKRGMDLLGAIFRGAAKRGSDKIAEAVRRKTGIDITAEAEQVADLVKEKTGIEIGDIADNKLTEEQWVQLKEFELQQEAQLQEAQRAVQTHELELERVLAEDRANARAAQTQRDRNEDPFVRRFTYYYAYLITALTFLFIFIVIFSGPPNDSDVWRVIDTVLGFLMGVGLSAIIQFFYGSSQGSRDKSRELNELARRASTTEGS